MVELSTSRIKAFSLTLCDGQAVVRNQKRVAGLLGVRMKDVPVRYHGLLAKANFMGGPGNETIFWTTDVFSSEPVRLSELSLDDRTRYREILKDALKAYASAVADAPSPVRRLIYAAVTYPSENAVFCADDRVVITEWGMTPVGEGGILGMPYSIDDIDLECPPRDGSVSNVDIGDIDDSATDSDSQGETLTQGAGEDAGKDLEDRNAGIQDSMTVVGEVDEAGGSGKTSGEKVGDGRKDPPIVPPVVAGDNPGRTWWKKWWIWVLAALLAVILFLLCRSCGSAPGIEPVTPELGEEDVVLSDDSLRYVARNRVLLILTDGNADLDRFAKDFRKRYSDSEKYILSNPDTVLKRVTLTLPADERKTMSERLPEEFESYGLTVIPETMYGGSDMTNDPDLQNAERRWYFDECSVFDAWDVTKGNNDVVVAVIDDGFDLEHPELAGKIVKPFNAVTHTDRVFPSPSGHGTHVAATAVGNAGNGAGIAGIAPGCRLMPIQVGDAGGRMTMSAILDGVAYAIENGADVVNMSLGMAFGPFVQFAPIYMQKNFRANMFLDEQRIWDYIFEIARQKNVTFVLAGGNENVIIGLDPMQRSGKTINVSAVQPDRAKANFSNFGDMSTVSAPGVHIFNAVPGNRYTFMDGTSMASPIVAGGCALLKSNDPTLSTAELVRILRQTGNPSPSDVGPIVNFARALRGDAGETPGDCDDINSRYQELLAELDKIRREHPGCIQTPDTLSLPDHFTVRDLTGRWKSTTSLFNQNNEQVVIYFTFDGTPKGRLEIVEPSGEVFSAPLEVAVADDVANINQISEAVGPSHRKYNPYCFVIRPDRQRRADGHADNKVEVANKFDFNLIRM